MKIINIAAAALLSFSLSFTYAQDILTPQPRVSSVMIGDFFMGMRKSCRQNITQRNTNPKDIMRGYQFCDCLSEQAQLALSIEDKQNITRLLTTQPQPQELEDYITTLIIPHMDNCGKGGFRFATP